MVRNTTQRKGGDVTPMDSIRIYKGIEHLGEYAKWKKTNREWGFRQVCDADLNIGFGITLPREYENNDSFLKNLVAKYPAEYIWIQQTGRIACIHYTKAAKTQLTEQGLTQSNKSNTTFCNGIYVYNKDTHKPTQNQGYVEFEYQGIYYKCIYDPDYHEANGVVYDKGGGSTQEYLIPTVVIPTEYLIFKDKDRFDKLQSLSW